jgi:PAS domain S-box-containing protein
MHNKLLLSQIKKHLGTETPPQEYETLFRVISETYDMFEGEKQTLEQSLAFTSREMKQLNERCREEAEESRSSHLQLKTLIDNIDDVFFTFDMVNKRIVQMSPACERIYGYSAEDFRNNFNLWFEVIPVEDRDIIEKHYPVMNAGERFTIEHRIITKTGEAKWVETKITPTLDKNKKLIRIDGLTIDITETKRKEISLRNARANLKNILDNTDTAYILFDNKINVLSYNHLAKYLVKYIVGVNIKEGMHGTAFLNGQRKTRFRKNVERILRTRQAIKYETQIVATDGKENWLSVSMYPIFNDEKELLGLSMAFNNITELKNSELERIRISNDLIQRNKDLEQFTYIISHNLRAPVANILGLSVLIRHPNTNRKVKGECLKGLETSVKRLDGVVSDLNQIIQVRRGIAEKKETAKFSSMVYNITDSIKYLVEKENVKISTNFSLIDEIFTVKSYMYSIFYNLISNSIKYRKAEEPPMIEISSRQDDKKTILSFKDNCLGIDLKLHKDKVFGLYKRFHQHVEGKGMGLYMVKTQVESLGGRIDIRSEVNKGTEIVLEFQNA